MSIIIISLIECTGETINIKVKHFQPSQFKNTQALKMYCSHVANHRNYLPLKKPKFNNYLNYFPFDDEESSTREVDACTSKTRTNFSSPFLILYTRTNSTHTHTHNQKIIDETLGK